MAMFDTIGDFMLPNDGNLSDKEEQREKKDIKNNPLR
ncbi:hypothetical protein SAMN05443270_3545 [Lacrimispora sphenoides]|jgi:hypothetical protein|nr:hypothetical protein SAMN05443270_3545 [Lacrimispora sphenoides]